MCNFFCKVSSLNFFSLTSNSPKRKSDELNGETTHESAEAKTEEDVTESVRHFSDVQYSLNGSKLP